MNDRPATAKWRENVRHRSRQRIPLGNICNRCGKKFSPRKLGRHHNWEGAVPFSPPKVEAVYCKLCHMIVEGKLKEVDCPDCGQHVVGWGKHKRKCKARAERHARQHREWLAKNANS